VEAIPGLRKLFQGQTCSNMISVWHQGYKPWR